MSNALIEQYANDLIIYSDDIGTVPMITVGTDGKGRLSIFASKILTHEQKCQLMIDAVQTLMNGIMDEQTRIKAAKILKPGQYRKLDD